ncbi:MAG: M99 family carboxypeptidase catalytic domain-containing protein [Campylobacterota bacterium]
MIAKLFLAAFAVTTYLCAANLHFDTFKKQGTAKGDTLLVIGGIHGDEPGSYFAPMLLATSYTIKKGNLWIVPNLNFDSIVKHRRGIYGDMNRKFAHIDKDDPDYEIVTDIKNLITQPEVDMVLNLHDGHGYYRPNWESSIFNPSAWGQASIIDQEVVPGLKYGQLDKIAKEVSRRLNNGYLDKNHHRFDVKNTNTEFKDEQQQLSLTFFSITHNKAAFAIETSKNIQQLHLKVFYQLQAIEAYMDIMGIEYTREFKLEKDIIKQKIQNYGKVTINNSIEFDLNEIKKILYYVPLPKKGTVIESDNPLVAFVPHKTVDNTIFKLNVGHKTISYLYPDYFDVANSLQMLQIVADGKKKQIKLPSTFTYKNSFKIQAPKGYRVNVIGFTGVKGNQNGITVSTQDIPKRFSLSKDEKSFRVEIYKDGNFVGMAIAKDIRE